MLAKGAYGTSLGENTYGMPGQPKPPAQKQTAGQQQNQQTMATMGWGQPQATDMSAYAPGRARPVQPQSQGTPFQAYSPQQNAQQNDNRWGAGNWAYSQAQPPGGAQPRVNTFYNNPMGNMANDATAPRPQPFTQSATGIDGQQFAAPQQAFTQRDAMIQRVNEARGPMFAGAGTYLGDGAPPPSWGQKPQMDFNTLMGQANQMVSDGWQNPFAPQPAGLSQRLAWEDPSYGGRGQTVQVTHPTPDDWMSGRGGPTTYEYSGGLPAAGGYGVMHPSSNPYRQPQFQEPTIPQVPGVQDYYPQDPGVPDERSDEQKASAATPAPTHTRAARPSSPQPGVVRPEDTPMYKSLFMGDTVRRDANGNYQVFDSAGRSVQSYNSSGALIGQVAGGRTGRTMWGETPQGSAELAERLRAAQDRERTATSQRSAETDAKLARLKELRKKSLSWGKLSPAAQGRTARPWLDEYQSLLRWAVPLAYNDAGLSPQQRAAVADFRQ